MDLLDSGSCFGGKLGLYKMEGSHMYSNGATPLLALDIKKGEQLLNWLLGGKQIAGEHPFWNETMKKRMKIFLIIQVGTG